MCSKVSYLSLYKVSNWKFQKFYTIFNQIKNESSFSASLDPKLNKLKDTIFKNSDTYIHSTANAPQLELFTTISNPQKFISQHSKLTSTLFYFFENYLITLHKHSSKKKL